ncbi:MAG: hypothetical protein MUO21_09915, partial [Nitrososphaeraceae archaeon]|nr:hypothetical protein [Nitrososphaeraceae archaeon]
MLRFGETMVLKYAAYGILIASIIFFSGCVENNRQIPSTVNGVALKKYDDNINFFSLNIPDNWKVIVGDYISAEDTSDNGITNIRIQPIHLSGKYRYISARDITNYLIGKEKQNYQNFNLISVKESGDKKIIEILVSFNDNGIDKKGVFTIFVNTPYAMLSGYETSSDEFIEKEELLSTIISSYQQKNPPEVKAVKEELKSNIGELREKNLDKNVKMLLPDGWKAAVFPGCTGLIAFDGELSKNTKGVIFMNGLHQSVEPLPSGVTPEDYVTIYMQNDFKTMSDIKIITHEDIDLSALRAGGANVQAIRISFKNNGVPSIGSITINTYGTAYSSAVGYVWGIYS